MPYLGPIRLPGSNLIDPRRQLADALLRGSVQRRPDTHWMQGLGRMGQALAGTYINNLSKQDQDKALETMMSGFADKTVTHAPIPNPQVKELESQAQTALGAAQDHMDQFGGIDNQGLGFQMTGDAQNLMRRASDLPEQITPEPTVIPGSTDRALQRLGALKGNVYAQNLYQQLLMQKMAEQQEEKRYKRRRGDRLEDMRTLRGFELEDRDVNRGFQLEDRREARDYESTIHKRDRGETLEDQERSLLIALERLKEKRAYEEQKAALARQNKNEDARGLIDYKNQNVRPVPGRDVPLPAQVQAQKLAQAQAGKPQFFNLSPGQKKIDQEFAKDYTETYLSGGLADAQKNLSQLDEVANRLDAVVSGESNENLTGNVLGNVPDFIKNFTNPASVDVRNQVEEVVQRNLRIVLGAQFTEKEGAALIARAFNPSLGEAENAKRVRRLRGAMQYALDMKAKAAQYFEENGTMQGFKGSTAFNAGFFENAIEGKGPLPASSGGFKFLGEKK